MENKLATHRWSVLHYLRPVTALEDYTSITRLNFKLSVYPLASNRQPFAGYSMVLQSVTLWHERWLVEGVVSFRKADYVSHFVLLLFFLFFFFPPHVESILLWSLLIDGFFDLEKIIYKKKSFVRSYFTWKNFRMIIEIKFEYYKFRGFINKIQFCLLKFK